MTLLQVQDFEHVQALSIFVKWCDNNDLAKFKQNKDTPRSSTIHNKDDEVDAYRYFSNIFDSQFKFEAKTELVLK